MDAGQDEGQPTEQSDAAPRGDAATGPVTIRPVATLSPQQVSAVEAICDAATRVDGVEPLSEHVRLHLRHGGGDHLHPARAPGAGSQDSDRHVLAESASQIVGYAHLDPTDQVDGAAAEIVVHPDRRGQGVGRRLVQAVLAASPDGRLRLWAHGLHPAARALADSLGFAEQRRLEQWRRAVDEPLPDVQLPPGVRLRAFVPGADDDAWLALNARAFADHPEQGGWTAGDLKVRLAESWFNPDGFLLAEEDDDRGVPRLIGFHWTKVHGGADEHHPHPHPDGDDHEHPDRPHQGHGHQPIGEVYVVGVDPGQQGRGLGRALTLAGLHWLRDHGPSQVMLYVESDNEPAKRVYRGLGFRHYDTDVMYHRVDDDQARNER